MRKIQSGDVNQSRLIGVSNGQGVGVGIETEAIIGAGGGAETEGNEMLRLQASMVSISADPEIMLYQIRELK